MHSTKSVAGPEPDKKKEIIPTIIPPDCPPAKPEILPVPEKTEPYHPLPETPDTPEPKTYPGKE